MNLPSILLLFTMAVGAVEEISIAIWPFEDGSPTPGHEALGPLLTESTTASLTRCPGLVVVERQRLLELLKELRLGSSELADERTRLQIGKIVGAEKMLFVTYMVVGDRLHLLARLVDVETALVEGTFEVQAALTEQEEALRQLERWLLNCLGLRNPKAPQPSPPGRL